jgi:hypothetical protein
LGEIQLFAGREGGELGDEPEPGDLPVTPYVPYHWEQTKWMMEKFTVY